MSYSSVGKPKFYIDYLSYLKTMGAIEDDYFTGTGNVNPIGLNPTEPSIFGPITGDNPSYKIELNQYLHPDMLASINYLGLIGHTYNSKNFSANESYPNSYMQLHFDTAGPNGFQGSIATEDFDQNIINTELSPDEDGIRFPNNGFSLTNVAFSGNSFDEVSIFNIKLRRRNFGNNPDGDLEDMLTYFMINSLILGHTYTMPRSPDLSLSMEIEYEGFDEQTTLSGSTLTNVRYTGQPLWGGLLNPWEIGGDGEQFSYIPTDPANYEDDIAGAPLNPNYLNSDSTLKRSGRRIWSLKWSYISETDMFASNYSSNTWLNINDIDNNYTPYTDNNDADDNEFTYTIADDSSIQSKLFHFIGNGARFLFQPNENASNPSDFAICVLDQDSLNIKQVAYNTYNISMKIREVW